MYSNNKWMTCQVSFLFMSSRARSSYANDGSHVPTDQVNTLYLHTSTMGGFASQEIKLAITLQVLGREMCLDCALFFKVNYAQRMALNTATITM